MTIETHLTQCYCSANFKGPSPRSTVFKKIIDNRTIVSPASGSGTPNRNIAFSWSSVKGAGIVINMVSVQILWFLITFLGLQLNLSKKI